jgi:sortase (surface protein transpeptidase)
MRPLSRRRTRLDLVALVVTVVCVAVAGWALLGLLADPVPDTEDFGADGAVVSAGPVLPQTAEPTDTRPEPTVAAGEDDTSAAQAAGPALTPPDRRSASLADQPGPAPAPVRLRVPEVGLDVPVDAVGVASDGQMEIPEDADRTGWYRYGSAPGAEAGSAVMAGHVDDRSGPGAFLALTEADKGAEIVVELADGTSATYRVVARTTVAKPELAVDDLFRRDGPPLLHLVTCAGEWSRQTGRYTDNLVITAEPVRG